MKTMKVAEIEKSAEALLHEQKINGRLKLIMQQMEVDE